MVSLQQQLRQEMAGVVQQVRAELNETAYGSLDMLNSIAAAMRRVTGNPVPMPYRISDFIPRNWEGTNHKETFRHPALVHASMV